MASRWFPGEKALVSESWDSRSACDARGTLSCFRASRSACVPATPAFPLLFCLPESLELLPLNAPSKSSRHFLLLPPAPCSAYYTHLRIFIPFRQLSLTVSY